MRYAQEKPEAICQALRTSADSGLTEQQAAEIQKAKGLNKFEEEKKETVPQKIAHQLKDITSLILLAASGIALLLAVQSGHGYTDAAVILAIVILNVVLAVRQEMGAEKALEALKSMNAHMTAVLRGGEKRSIDAVELVPGDILLLETGDMIPADARILESVNLKAEESILTGESVPVEKDAQAAVPEKAALGDQLNMLFSGCLITNGRARAVVVETGMRTEMGKIAGLLNSTKKLRTPLQKRLAGLAKTMSFIALGAAAVMFALELLYGVRILEILMNAVALAVAVVPETLPVIVTITLAFGIHNMARKHAIIRKIPAVETLGSASVICSDKTGTLTMNRMSIQKIWAAGREPLDAAEAFGHEEMFLLEIMGLASNAALRMEGGEEKALGDPTETAIIRLLLEKKITKESLDAIFPKVFEIPFDSGRKRMTTVHELEDGRYLSITKGAFDRLPAEAASYCADTAKRVHDSFAGGALRVLAAAYKYYDTLPGKLDADELEQGLTFAGFVGMIDPPRPESVAAVAAAKRAGIRTVMITGDHVATASAIARQIGILSEGDKAVSGAELEAMPEEELTRSIRDYAVYARVSPEDKIRIVKAWQAHGEVVAMTGDGVNDAPALKAADVGVAMGSGTDVSKSASDMILTDDNFASIVDAVAEGRRVYDNIRKVLYSLLSCNISEIFIMLAAILFGWGAPLMAIQLLLINVVADGIPDMFMCKEPAEEGSMKRSPVKKNAGIFAGGLAKKIGLMSLVFTVISLIGFYIGKFVAVGPMAPSHEIGQTMAFVIIGWSSVVNIFNARCNTRSVFQIGVLSNKALSLALLFSFGLIAAVAAVPALMKIFYCVPVSLNHWLIMLGLSVVPLIVGEIEKLVYRKRSRSGSK
ncbi:MAG: cation-translocating P-type ATPase [Oscillospiraceae bacterium]|nr:cation-translocating P-type ATPase [Oscillospiraceae bacterium]